MHKHMTEEMRTMSVMYKKIIDLQAKVEQLEQTALNGAECSNCGKEATEPVCMYCHPCYCKQLAEVERLEGERDEARAIVRDIIAETEGYLRVIKTGPSWLEDE